MTSRICLSAGRMTLALAPDRGGAIAAFRRGAVDLMRPMPPDGSVREAACFPMLPYTGRIADGRFRYGDHTYQLPINLLPNQPHAIHGDGWQAVWQAVAYDERSATLAYRHDGTNGWPFRYSALQAFTLFEDGLEIRVTVVNEDCRSFAAGMGLHPYFPLRDAQLTARLPEVWLMDERKIPIDREPTPDAWDFSAPRPVAGSGLDHCFAEWDGEAVIDWPELGLSMQMTADGVFDHCVVYVPDGRGFFCVEPTSHRNDGINQQHDDPPTGLIDLDPGEALSGRVVFVVREGEGA